MERFITTIKNIWKIQELRNRILFTLLLLFVYRLGSFIVLPGALPKVLKSASGGQGGNAQDLLGLINSFTGGAFSNASILALGIMPYITASDNRRTAIDRGHFPDKRARRELLLV